MPKRYAADFETTTSTKDCRVWAYSLCNIDDFTDFIYGNSIEDFINFCKNKKENYTLYMHNLKFDGEFIISYLLNNDYNVIKEKKDRKDKTFTALISETGQFYVIEIYFEVKGKRVNKVKIINSLNMLNMSIEKIAKDFNLPIRKLHLDYKKSREVGHTLEKYEISYIKNDVEILARALKIMFDEGLTKMTIGSNALNKFKEGLTSFDNYFPRLTNKQDKEIREAYKGGWCYLNPIYKEQHLGKGIVLDKNSMYPTHMRNDYLPIGEPVFFEGEYQKDICYPLYIQILSCSFKIKENKLPIIQIKDSFGYYPNEYIEDSGGEIITLTLTNMDLELFKKNYNLDNIVYHSGYKFRRLKGLFTNYIDYWYQKKIEAKKENNGSLYSLSKLLLNALYGKFGSNPEVRNKFPVLEKGIVKYKMYDKEMINSVYCPIACFVTSYARCDIVETCQKVRDYSLEKYGKDFFVYADTDSCHFLGMDIEEIKDILEIDEEKLGAYKQEMKFNEAVFIRSKCYIEEDIKGNLKTTVAGLPKNLGRYINLENFKRGFSILQTEEEKEHKLKYLHVKGGVVLVDTDFTIK